MNSPAIIVRADELHFTGLSREQLLTAIRESAAANIVTADLELGESLSEEEKKS